MTPDDLPRGTTRFKAKCADEGGLCCTKEGHPHERIIINTAGLPNRWQDKQLTRAWQQVMQADPIAGCESWSAVNMRRDLSVSRSKLVTVPEYMRTCVICGGEKEHISHGRCDCVGKFTDADTILIRDKIAPQMLTRVKRHTQRNTVTVETASKVKGRVGGHDAGIFMRQVFD